MSNLIVHSAGNLKWSEIRKSYNKNPAKSVDYDDSILAYLENHPILKTRVSALCLEPLYTIAHKGKFMDGLYLVVKGILAAGYEHRDNIHVEVFSLGPLSFAGDFEIGYQSHLGNIYHNPQTADKIYKKAAGLSLWASPVNAISKGIAYEAELAARISKDFNTLLLKIPEDSLQDFFNDEYLLKQLYKGIYHKVLLYSWPEQSPKTSDLINHYYTNKKLHGTLLDNNQTMYFVSQDLTTAVINSDLRTNKRNALLSQEHTNIYDCWNRKFAVSFIGAGADNKVIKCFNQQVLIKDIIIDSQTKEIEDHWCLPYLKPEDKNCQPKDPSMTTKSEKIDLVFSHDGVNALNTTILKVELEAKKTNKNNITLIQVYLTVTYGTHENYSFNEEQLKTTENLVSFDLKKSLDYNRNPAQIDGFLEKYNLPETLIVFIPSRSTLEWLNRYVKLRGGGKGFDITQVYYWGSNVPNLSDDEIRNFTMSLQPVGDDIYIDPRVITAHQKDSFVEGLPGPERVVRGNKEYYRFMRYMYLPAKTMDLDGKSIVKVSAFRKQYAKQLIRERLNQRIILRMIQEVLYRKGSRSSNLNVLDFGTGFGTSLNIIKTFFNDLNVKTSISATDFDQDSLNQISPDVKAGVHIEAMPDLNSLPFNDGVFDVVFAIFVLHFPISNELLSQIQRCIKPSGLFIFNTYKQTPADFEGRLSDYGFSLEEAIEVLGEDRHFICIFQKHD